MRFPFRRGSLLVAYGFALPFMRDRIHELACSWITLTAPGGLTQCKSCEAREGTVQQQPQSRSKSINKFRASRKKDSSQGTARLGRRDSSSCNELKSPFDWKRLVRDWLLARPRLIWVKTQEPNKLIYKYLAARRPKFTVLKAVGAP